MPEWTLADWASIANIVALPIAIWTLAIAIRGVKRIDAAVKAIDDRGAQEQVIGKRLQEVVDEVNSRLSASVKISRYENHRNVLWVEIAEVDRAKSDEIKALGTRLIKQKLGELQEFAIM